ncbi:MAG: transferrin-binding protein-like solute binding protein, partial [Alphaproteobacteria bacterium]|nr:transferrin-binding protein-like solute binding protein [Alphaproteobacteria bacterium]
MKSLFRKTLTPGLVLLTASILGGCFGGGGGGAALGTAANPWTVPLEYDPAAPKDIAGLVSTGGVWKFPYDHVNVNASGAWATFGMSMAYDTVNDTWTVSVNGADHTLAADGSDPSTDYATGTCGTELCIVLDLFDASEAFDVGILGGFFLGGRYGSFGTVTTEDPTGDVDIAYFYTGLKTPATGTDGMPTTGTAAYGMYFKGEATAVGGTMHQTVSAGGADGISVDFGTGDVTFSSSGDVLDGGGAVVASYTLNSTGTITGNRYDSTRATGSLSIGALADTSYSGSMEGAFYGPAAVETAGVISVTNSTGDRISGGFYGRDP